MISRFERLFFALLALFPFGMGAVYALINMTGGWIRFSSHRGYAFYGVLPGGFDFWIGLSGAGVIFALAWILSHRIRSEYKSRRDIITDLVWIFLTGFVLRLAFCLIFAHGIGNSGDSLWCWQRVCGFPVSDNRHILFPAWMNFALYMKGFVSLFGNHYGLFQLVQTVWGGLGTVAVFLLGYELTRSRTISVCAGLLYAFSPSAIVYLSAWASPEHQSVPLFCLSSWLFLRCVIREMSFKRLLAHFIAAGVCLGVGDAIKPFSPVFLPAAVIFVLFVIFRAGENRSRATLNASAALAGLIAVRCVVCSFITTASEHVFDCELDRADSVPHFLSVGLDRHGEGMIHLARYGSTYRKARMAGETREAAAEKMSVAIKNDWRGHWLEAPRFLFKKTVWAWQDDVPSFLYWKRNLHRGYSVPEYLKKAEPLICRYGASSALVYYFILMVLSCVFAVRNAFLKSQILRMSILLPGLLIMGFAALMLISESQGRYKCLVMPYITVFAACAFCRRTMIEKRATFDGETDDRLCVVMPVYNEEAAIGMVLEKWTKALDVLGINYVIRPYNDGSKDGSLTAMRTKAEELNDDGRLRVDVRDKKNGGHGNTILTGYREAAREGFGWIFQIDSDDEMGPERFGELWKRRNDYDFLVGIRDGRVQVFPRKAISFLSRFSVRLFYGKSVWDVNTPYRLMRTAAFKRFFEAIPPTTFAPNVILSGLAARYSLRRFETRVPQYDRTTGEVSIRKWKLFKAAVLSFVQTVSFSITDEMQ